MKLRFLAGVATAIARANGRDKLPRFQAAIGELIALVSVAEGIRAGAIEEGLRRADALPPRRLQIKRDRLSRPEARGRLGGAPLHLLFSRAHHHAAHLTP